MTTNEVVENIRKVYLDFSPASIEITNYDELKNEVEKFSKRYTGIAFGRDEKKDAEEIRSRLIALKEALETERKEVKNVYNKPLDEFQSKIKDLTQLIDKPLDEIREGLKEIERYEKEERELALKTFLESKLEEVGLSIESIEINPKWLAKGQWTAKMNPSKKLESEIDSAINAVLKENERRETELKLLESFCESVGVDSAGWVSQLNYRGAMEVIDLINLDRDRKKRLEEEQAKKQEEHAAFLLEQQKTLEEAKAFVTEKAEPMVPELVFSASLKIFGTERQLKDLNEYIKMTGMKVEEIPEPKESVTVIQTVIPEKGKTKAEVMDEVEDWITGFDLDDIPL